MTNEDKSMMMFGCTAEQMDRLLALPDPLMVTMSLLSDAQELIASSQPESARRTINQAKRLIMELRDRDRTDGPGERTVRRR